MAAHHKVRNFVFVCQGKGCQDKGSRDIGRAFKKAVANRGLGKKSRVLRVMCVGRCKDAPIAIIDRRWFPQLTRKRVKKIVKKRLR